MIKKATTLNQTLDNDVQLPSSTLQDMQENITALLEVLRKRRFLPLHQNATLEKSTNKTLKAVDNDQLLRQSDQLKPKDGEGVSAERPLNLGLER